MFIVLEGLDGAGKSTQVRRLRAWLESEGHRVESLHFPRYDAPFFGELITRFLRGDFGSADAVDPYLAALLFACDRADAAPRLRGWLSEGRTVLLDRYVWSNVAYQCAKFRGTEEECRRLARWILALEYEHYGMPRPDVSFFLDAPLGFVADRLAGERAGEDRAYLDGGSDIHETSLELQRRVRSLYREAAQIGAGPVCVECGDGAGGMADADTVFARIRQALAPFIDRRP